MPYNQNIDSVTETENKRIERREFLKNTFGLLAVIGMAFINLKCAGSTGKKKIVIIDLAKCNGCGKCIRKCKHKALSVKNKKAEINQKLCSGCGDCADACTRKAILEKNSAMVSTENRSSVM